MQKSSKWFFTPHFGKLPLRISTTTITLIDFMGINHTDKYLSITIFSPIGKCMCVIFIKLSLHNILIKCLSYNISKTYTMCYTKNTWVMRFRTSSWLGFCPKALSAAVRSLGFIVSSLFRSKSLNTCLKNKIVGQSFTDQFKFVNL